jgi:hypothetical protein
VLQFVCCVFGVIPNSECQNAAFWHLGSMAAAIASTTCNNLIADLLFLRKCHAPA